jgi:hypothetical protein
VKCDARAMSLRRDLRSSGPGPSRAPIVFVIVCRHPGARVVDRVAARISLEGRSPHWLLTSSARHLSEALDTV